MGKKHRHPQTHPFIVGDGRNRAPADDIFGVIIPNAPSARSSGWCIWCHALGNACWKYTTGGAQPVTSMLCMGVYHNQGLWPWLQVHREILVQKGYRQFVLPLHIQPNLCRCHPLWTCPYRHNTPLKISSLGSSGA